MVLAIVACSEKRQAARHLRAHAADSTYTVDAAMAVYDTLPERALAILDSAYLVGNIPNYIADLYRARIYNLSFNSQKQDSTFVLCQSLLQHDSVVANPTLKQNVLELLVSASRMREDHGQLVTYSEELTYLLRQQGLITEALRTQAETGLALANLGQEEEGMAKIDDAISRLDGVRRFNELDAAIIAIRRKINVLAEKGRYAEILPLAQHIQERMEDYEKHPDIYHDNTYREPSAEDRPRYIGFNRSMAALYKARAYVGMENKAQAKKALDEFRTTDYSRTNSGRLAMASLLGSLGEYDQMLAIYDAAEETIIAKADTLSDDYLTIIRDRAVAEAAKGHADSSQQLWLRYENLQQMKSDSLQRSKAHLYAAMYSAKEKEQAIKDKEKELSLARWVVGILGFLFILALGTAIYALRRWEEQKRRSEELKPAEEAEETPAPKTPKLDEMDNSELFEYIRDYIIRNELYLDPMFGRQTLVDRLGISTHRIGAAFAKGSSYKALPEFIRHLRLEHACQLLKQDANLSVKAVGEASGFSNNSTFCSDFKKRYGVTPSDYRKV